MRRCICISGITALLLVWQSLSATPAYAVHLECVYAENDDGRVIIDYDQPIGANQRTGEKRFREMSGRFATFTICHAALDRMKQGLPPISASDTAGRRSDKPEPKGNLANAAALGRRCITLIDRGRSDALGWVHMYRNSCPLIFEVDVACPGGRREPHTHLQPTGSFRDEQDSFSNCKAPGTPKVWYKSARAAT